MQSKRACSLWNMVKKTKMDRNESAFFPAVLYPFIWTKYGEVVNRKRNLNDFGNFWLLRRRWIALQYNQFLLNNYHIRSIKGTFMIRIEYKYWKHSRKEQPSIKEAMKWLFSLWQVKSHFFHHCINVFLPHAYLLLCEQIFKPKLFLYATCQRVKKIIIDNDSHAEQQQKKVEGLSTDTTNEYLFW